MNEIVNIYLDPFYLYSIIANTPTASSGNCAYILPFCHRGLKLTLFSLYRQWFPRYGPISNFPCLGMKLCFCPQFQKLHLYFLSTPKGVEAEIIFAL